MDTDYPQRVHCYLPSCWSAGSGFLKEVISDFCIEVVCTMRAIGLIRNFFLRRYWASFQDIQEHFFWFVTLSFCKAKAY
jgi:hypothetical protein